VSEKSDLPRLPWLGWGWFRAGIRSVALVGLGLVLAGCDALNPSFVEVMLPAERIPPQVQVTDNPRGHVPVFFVSNARYDGALLQYMANQGLDVSDANLRPRVRVQVQVSFSDGTSRVLEFLDGAQISQSATLIEDETEVAVIPPDLARPPLNNQVLQCDVAGVVVAPTAIEVYIPVFWGEFERVDIQQFGSDIQLVELYPPQFYVLQVDDVDSRGDTVVLRNIGVRDVAGPILNLTCGSVVMYSLEGTLQMPFVPFEGGFPGYLRENQATIDAFPGRFAVKTQVR